MLNEAQVKQLQEELEKLAKGEGFGLVVVQMVDHKPRWIYTVSSSPLNPAPKGTNKVKPQ